MNRSIGLPILICVVIIVSLVVFLLHTSRLTETYAQSAYPPPELSYSPQPLHPIQYPTSADVTIDTPPNSTEDVITVEVSMEVTVEGLEEVDTVELQIVPDTEKTTSRLQALGINFSKIRFSNETGMVNTTGIPIGTYKLMVIAPDSYFREPQGYLFRLTETGIVNHSGASIHFELIPPSAQDYPPCRETMAMGSPKTTYPSGDIPFEEPKNICRAERLIDLSSPPKQPERLAEYQQETVLDTGYHYTGPNTFQDNQGVWGRNYVVDPGVDHPGTATRFVVERVYANDSTHNNWMEAGWAEHSSRDDQQYVYEYDSATQTWHYFDQFILTVGSIVETEVYYNPSINKWWGLYHIGGSNWAILAEESLGFTTADNGYNRGEIYTGDGAHPILPPSSFDLGYLYIGGIWRQWDTQYLTSEAEDFPYECDMINQYFRFTIHSPVIFLPLLVKD